MNQDELLKQLNKLSKIKPSKHWKETNREILLTQISNSVIKKEPEKISEKILAFRQNVIKLMRQPTWVVLFVLFILGGALGIKTVYSVKPGDSLYITKIITEKAQLAITFNKDKKNRLNMKFASDRAKKITEVLVDSDSEDIENQEKIEKLSNDFKKEIDTVKSGLAMITRKQEQTENDNNDDNEAEINEINEVAEVIDNQDETEVFSANLGKEEQGMQVSEKKEEKTVDDILEDAERLFDEKKYDETLDELAKIDNYINNDDSNDSEDMAKTKETDTDIATSTIETEDQASSTQEVE